MQNLINNKYKIVKQLKVGKYSALELDRPIEDIDYNGFIIDGIEYRAVPIYDMPDNIAIESDDDFVGKEVECVIIPNIK